MTILKRQVITDSTGTPIGVILPIEEYRRVSSILEQPQGLDDQLLQMGAAAHDQLFLADLDETMTVFEHSDNEWWERES